MSNEECLLDKIKKFIINDKIHIVLILCASLLIYFVMCVWSNNITYYIPIMTLVTIIIIFLPAILIYHLQDELKSKLNVYYAGTIIAFFDFVLFIVTIYYISTINNNLILLFAISTSLLYVMSRLYIVFSKSIRDNRFEFIEAVLWTALSIEIVLFIYALLSDKEITSDITKALFNSTASDDKTIINGSVSSLGNNGNVLFSLNGSMITDNVFAEHLANFGGIIGFTVAMLLLVISYVRAKQTDKQIEISNKQVAMAQQQKRQDLYVNSFSLLSSDNENGHSRIAGIYGLMSVIKEAYDDYETNHSKSHSKISTYLTSDNEVNQAGHTDKVFTDYYNYIKHIHDIIFQHILIQSPKGQQEFRLELQGIFNVFDEKFGNVGEVFRLVKNLNGANLSGLNLSGLNLSYADLQGANLQGANLHNINLQDANLEEAGLQGATLINANLKNANLQNSKIQGIDLKDAILKGSNLRNVNLRGFDLSSINLEDVELRGANLKDTQLNYKNLQNTKIIITTRDNKSIFKSISDLNDAIGSGVKLYNICNQDNEIVLNDKREFVYKETNTPVEIVAYFVSSEFASEDDAAYIKLRLKPKTKGITAQIETKYMRKAWLICKCTIVLNELGEFVYKYNTNRKVSFTKESNPPRDSGDTYNHTNDYINDNFTFDHNYIMNANVKNELYFTLD